MKFLFATITILIVSAGAFGQKYHPEVQAIRDVVEKWSMGYQAMEPDSMSATIAMGHELVDRSGKVVYLGSRENYERFWSLAFKNDYAPKPGPEYRIDSVRFLNQETAVVYATATRSETDALPNGKTVLTGPQLSTFVLVKKDGVWQIALHSVHDLTPVSEKTGSRQPGAAS